MGKTKCRHIQGKNQLRFRVEEPIKKRAIMISKPNRIVMTTAVIYVIVAIGWDCAADFFLGKNGGQNEHFIFLDQLKDSIFAVLTGGLLYLLLRRSLQKREKENQAYSRAMAEKEDQARIFSELFLVVQDAVFLVDVETQRFLDANPAAEKMYGYSRAEFLKKKGPDISAEPEATQHVIATHQSHVPLRWHRRKNGEIFPIEATTNCFEHRGRKIHVALMRDITERRKAESVLQESEARYRRLFEMESDAIILLERDTLDIVDANQSAVSLYGYSREEFLRLKAPDVSAEPEMSRQAIQSDEKLSSVRWHRRKNGEHFPVEIFGNNFELNGRRMKMGAIRDISARFKIEQALKQSEEKYRSLFEHMNEGVAYCQMIYVDGVPVDYVHLMVNEKGATIAGLKDIAGKRATELMPDFRENDPETFKILSRVAATGMPETVELFVASVQKWLHLSIYSPQQGFFVVVYDDITGRKRVEEQTRQQSALINSLLDSIPDLVFYKDLNGVMLGCNPAFEEFNGRKREMIVGRTDRELFDLAGADFFREEDVKRLAAMEPWQNEEWVTYPDGRRVLLHTLKTPYRGPDGNVIGVLGISRDITARHLMEQALREREEQLVLFVEHSPAAIAMLNHELKYVVASRRWVEDFRLGSTPLTGRSHYEVFPEVPSRWKEIHQRCLAGAVEKCDEEEFRRADGTSDWIRWEVRPWRQAEGTIGGIIIFSEDISARKKAEAALRENQQLLRTVIDLVPHFIFAKDIHSRYLFLNKACATAHGKTPEQMVGKSTLEFVSDRKQAEAFMRDDLEVITSGRQKFVAEEHLTNAAGERRILQTIKTPFTLPGQAEPALVGVAVDITDIKKAGEALRLSEERFRLLWRQSADGIRLTDAAGNVVMANAAYCQLMELPPESVEGRAMCEVYLAEKREKILNDHRIKFAARDVAARVETQVTLWNGKKLWLEVSNSFLEHPGTEPLLLAMFRDVTPRRQADEQMRLQSSTLTAAANAIFITNIKGDIEWVNPAFCELTGYTSEEVIGKNPRLLKSGDQPREFYTELWKTILAGNVWHGELVNRRKNGSRYHESMTVTPVRNAAGKVTHFVAIKQDITERKQLNARLQQAEKMEAIGTLAGGIAHDFNNILAAMFGYGYLLQSDCEGNVSAAENITEILKAATRAKDLVQQILTFSRQREQKRQVVRLNTVIKEAMKFMRASLPAGIRIDMDLQDDAPPVFADPSQVYQVVLNLATNSFHAMEGSHGTLTVSLREFIVDDSFRREHPEIMAGTCVQLVIADTGHGMKPEVLAHLFEPFFTTKAVGKGTGLGLAVVHGIVKSHDGAIEVESHPGQGTSFRIYFPARPGEQVAAAAESNRLPRGQGQHILVVDDEVAITGVFQKLLKRLNYCVTTTNSPVTALEIFSRAPDAFALVITDRTMPDMDGFELANRIHELNPRVPVVLASGQTTELTEAHLAKAGIVSVLEKPVVNATFAKLIAQFLAAPGG